MCKSPLGLARPAARSLSLSVEERHAETARASLAGSCNCCAITRPGAACGAKTFENLIQEKYRPAAQVAPASGGPPPWRPTALCFFYRPAAQVAPPVAGPHPGTTLCFCFLLINGFICPPGRTNINAEKRVSFKGGGPAGRGDLR